MFHAQNKLYSQSAICYLILIFITTVSFAKDISDITFYPLHDGETLDYSNYYSGTGIDDHVEFYKESGESRETIIIVRGRGEQIINDKLYFNYSPDISNRYYEGFLYVIDGKKGTITNLGIPIINGLFIISHDEKYITYVIKSNDITYEGDFRTAPYMPAIGVEDFEKGKKYIFDFSQTFLSKQQYLNISIDYAENSCILKYYDSETNITFIEGYIDLRNMQFYLTKGEANGYVNPPPAADMSDYKATHTTLDRLCLRDSADTSSTTVTVLPQDTAVQELETGLTATIDGITAPWVRVLSSTGYEGWCFSGYLEPVSTPLPSPPEPAIEKPVAAEGSVLTETNWQDEAAAIAEIAATRKKQGGIPVPVRIAIGVGILLAVGILFGLKSKKSRSRKR